MLGGRAILSLAGVTNKPIAPFQRRGGFGGVEGLGEYLQAENISALIDATHPFASQMSWNASQAAVQAGLPLLRLARPPWPVEASWKQCSTLQETAMHLPAGARVFLSVGSQSLEPFLERRDVWFLCRSIEPPARLPINSELILARPPFSYADELSLLKTHKITHLVSKNAGGTATKAKLEAAATLGIKVVMVKRPQLPAAFEVETVQDALKWVAELEDKK